MDKALIQEAADSLVLVDVFPFNSSVERKDDFFRDNIPEGMIQQNKIGVETSIYQSKDSDERLVRAKASFGIRFSLEDDEQKNVLGQIEAEFIAEYKMKHPISDEAMNEFTRFNVVHNVWPFWREFAFRTANDTKLPKPIIPLMKGQVFAKKQ